MFIVHTYSPPPSHHLNYKWIVLCSLTSWGFAKAKCVPRSGGALSFPSWWLGVLCSIPFLFPGKAGGSCVAPQNTSSGAWPKAGGQQRALLPRCLLLLGPVTTGYITSFLQLQAPEILSAWGISTRNNNESSLQSINLQAWCCIFVWYGGYYLYK